MTAAANWLTLDTAGKLFPAIESIYRTETFRLSVTLKELIDPGTLQSALEYVIHRFPSFKVRMQKGLFWYYFDPNEKTPIVEPDTLFPSRRIDRGKSRDYLFRVFHRNRTISIDFFHAITDGTGGLVFLKTLTAEYLKRVHAHLHIPCTDGVMDCESEPHPEESDDAYKQYYKGPLKRYTSKEPVYHLRGRKEPRHIFHFTRIIINAAAMQERLKLQGIKVTEYMASILVYALSLIQNSELPKRKHKPIRISIPVDMRRIYPSRTMRNFTLFVTPGIEPNLGDYSFREVLNQIHFALGYEMSEKFLSAELSSHVSVGNNPVIRFTPRIVKDRIMLFVYKNFGEKRYSTTISNLGKIVVPDEMAPYVERINFNLPPNRINMSSATLTSFGENMYLTVTSILRQPLLEQAVFRTLGEQQIHYSVETNRPGGLHM